MVGRGSESGNVALRVRYEESSLMLHLVGFLYYFTYIDDVRSNTNQVNFVGWRLIFPGPQYVTCSWCLEF